MHYHLDFALTEIERWGVPGTSSHPSVPRQFSFTPILCQSIQSEPSIASVIISVHKKPAHLLVFCAVRAAPLPLDLA